MLTDEAEDQAVDGFGNVEGFVVLNEKSLQLIVVECFTSEFNVLMTDVRKHRCLGMQVIILTSFRNNASFNVTEKNDAVYLWA